MRTAAATLFVILFAIPHAHATPLDTMTAPEVDKAACGAIEHREHIRALASGVATNPRLRPAEKDVLLVQHADMLRQLANTADLIRERQRAFKDYDFQCRP